MLRPDEPSLHFYAGCSTPSTSNRPFQARWSWGPFFVAPSQAGGGSTGLRLAMDEIRESSYLFSLRQLEDMEKDRRATEMRERVARAAERKHRISELETNLRVATENAEFAVERAQLAETREQKAHRERHEALRQLQVLQAKLQSDLTFQRESVALEQQHASQVLRDRARSALGWWRGLSVVGLVSTLVASGAFLYLYSHAADARFSVGQQHAEQAQVWETERQDLYRQLRDGRARAAQLQSELGALKQRLAELPSAPSPTPRSEPRRRVPVPAPVETPKRVDCGDPNDPLNPCLPS